MTFGKTYVLRKPLKIFQRNFQHTLLWMFFLCISSHMIYFQKNKFHRSKYEVKFYLAAQNTDFWSYFQVCLIFLKIWVFHSGFLFLAHQDHHVRRLKKVPLIWFHAIYVLNARLHAKSRNAPVDRGQTLSEWPCRV